MKDIYNIPITQTMADELTTREWLVLCWIKMGKPKNLTKFMTKSWQIRVKAKNRLFDKGYLTEKDFKSHNKHIRRSI